MLESVDGGERGWKRRNERLADPCISETDRYVGGCISHGVGCDSGWHRTDLLMVQENLNGVQYRDEILQQQVEPFCRTIQR